MRHWYLSLCMCGFCSAGWIQSNHQTRRHTYTVTNTSVAQIQEFSPDDGHVDALYMEKREINKYIKQNCASSWIYLLDVTDKINPKNTGQMSSGDIHESL